MQLKTLFTVIGFNGLVLLFLVGVVAVYFRPAWFGLMASSFLGWLTGFINLNTSEAQLPILLLLSFGFILGFVLRGSAWKYALILGLFVPVWQLLWIAASRAPELWLTDGLGSFIALIPAFGGTYLGRFVASAAGPNRETPQTNDGRSG